MHTSQLENLFKTSLLLPCISGLGWGGQVILMQGAHGSLENTMELRKNMASERSFIFLLRVKEGGLEERSAS